jgi:hypothetical protein
VLSKRGAASVLDMTAAERRHRQFVATVPIRAGTGDFSTPEAWARAAQSAVTPDVFVKRRTAPMFAVQIKNFMPSTSWSKRDIETWVTDHKVRAFAALLYPAMLVRACVCVCVCVCVHVCVDIVLHPLDVLVQTV